MKKTQMISMILVATLLVSSCTTPNQVAGGVTGAAIGSRVGGAVGAIASGGRFVGRSSALGALVGAGVGAIIGVGITSEAEKNENNYLMKRKTEKVKRSAGIIEQNQGVNIRETPAREANPTALSELTYMDVTGDGAISKNETIELEGYVTNTSDDVLSNVVIQLNISDTKAFLISPPLTTDLQPGQKIRYNGRVHCRKTRRNHAVEICLTTICEGKKNKSSSLFIQTR